MLVKSSSWMVLNSLTRFSIMSSNALACALFNWWSNKLLFGFSILRSPRVVMDWSLCPSKQLTYWELRWNTDQCKWINHSCIMYSFNWFQCIGLAIFFLVFFSNMEQSRWNCLVYIYDLPSPMKTRNILRTATFIGCSLPNSSAFCVG